MVSHGRPLEVVGTVLEVADVALTAFEIHHRHQIQNQNQNHQGELNNKAEASAAAAAASPYLSLEEEMDYVKSENSRLKSVLENNLKLLQQLSLSPSLSKDCPPDLYARLLCTVDSSNFLTQLESLHQASVVASNNSSPSKEPTGADLHSLEILVNVDPKEPSWWVWVTDEMVPSALEELSGIDNDSYVIVGEDHVVDGVANFMAGCILANPKSKGLTPEELQKTVAKALDGMNKWEKMEKIWHAGKLIYALSTWGLALAGLYRHRAILKMAAQGIRASSKVVLKAP